jgi:Uncharacterized conserved protein (DUF2285)
LTAGPRNSRSKPPMHRGKSTQKRSGAQTNMTFVDEPPQTPRVTDYDRQHLALYVRLLDAAEEGAEWTEVVDVLFGLDPNRDRERARRVHDNHLARARWMTEHGHRDLLRSGMH